MLLIFDWDGTLSDSTDRIVGCVERAGASLGLPVLPREAILDIIGLSLPVAVARLYPQLSERDLGRLAAQFSAQFVAVNEAPSDLYPGVASALRDFKARGYRLAVATGKSRRGLDRVLQQLGWQDFFDASRCADETASKPEPLMLRQLLDQFGVHEQAALMVGDTEYDMAMARALGMPRAAVSYGAHHIDRLRPYEPVLCMDRFAELDLWLQGIEAGGPQHGAQADQG